MSPPTSQTRRSRSIVRPSHRAASRAIAAVAAHFVHKSVHNFPGVSSYSRLVSAGLSISRKRRLFVAVLGTAMMALAGCSSTGPATPEESVTSSTEAGAVLDATTATRLDDAIGRAMTAASIPGAIVGIWGPAGDYVRTFGVNAGVRF